MAWSFQHLRACGAIGAISIIALFVGCFDGEQALGYPCESDADCGPSLACESTGCCGGACRFGGETSESTSTSNATETSTSTSSTTIDPTTESGSESSSSTGPQPICGDGVVDEGEECDLGDDNNDLDFTLCSTECVGPLFYFSSAEPEDDDFCGIGAECVGWDREDAGDAPWGSGDYPMVASANRLISRSIMIPFPPPDGKVAALLFHHDADFNVCEIDPEMPEYFDGGRVLMDGGVTGIYQVSPTFGELYSGPPDCIGSGAPWCMDLPPVAIFRGTSDGPHYAEVAEVPQAFVGTSMRLVFEAGFDDGNCEEGPPGRDPNPWLIDEVIVAFIDL